jgi:hypothetical protein
MNRNIYFFIAAMLFSLQALAQDKIYKKNGDVVEAKVIEIGETEIKYKIFTDQEGPTYSVDKDRLKKIIYQTGREETFVNSLRDTSLYADQTKSAIKFNFLAPLGGYTQLSYERNIKPGRSYEISLGIIGLGLRQKREDVDYNYNPNEFSTSTRREFYRGAAGAFIGAGYKFIKLPNFVRSGDKYSHILQGFYAKPEILLGIYSQNQYNTSRSGQNTEERESVVLGAFVINLGKQWVLGESFLLDLYGGMGYALDSQDNSNFFNNYGGNHFGLQVAGETGVGFTGGFKIGLLLNKKKTK